MQTDQIIRAVGRLLIFLVGAIALMVMIAPLAIDVIEQRELNILHIAYAVCALYVAVIISYRALKRRSLEISVTGDSIRIKNFLKEETFKQSELFAWSYREGADPALILHPKEYNKSLIVIPFSYHSFEEIENWAKLNYPNRDEIPAEAEWKEILTQLKVREPDQKKS